MLFLLNFKSSELRNLRINRIPVLLRYLKGIDTQRVQERSEAIFTFNVRQLGYCFVASLFAMTVFAAVP